MSRGLTGQRLLLVFLVAAVVFNDPVLSLFDRGASWLGLPVLYVYLFAAWAGVIALLAATVRADRDGD